MAKQMRYLILTYYKKPDGRIDEAMEVSKRLKTRDLQTANVILDFKKLQVEKASMNGVNVPRDFNRIVEYYMQHYENIITRLFKENGYEIEFNKNENQTQSPAADPS
jgi:hypothetical protein